MARNIFTVSRKVVFGDCDAARILYTPRLSHFIVEAVGEFMDHAFGTPHIRAAFDRQVSLPCRALTSEFLSPMTWDDVIEIQIWPEHIGRTSMTIVCSGSNQNGVNVFTGALTYVSVCMKSGKAIELPSDWRSAVEKIGDR